MRDGRVAVLTVFLLVGQVAACVPNLARFAARPDVVDARAVVDTLAHGDVAAVSARLVESQQSPDTTHTLELMVGQFPQGAPSDVHLVNYQVQTVKKVGGSKTTTSNVSFESRYDSGYVLTNVVLVTVDDGPRRILALHTQPMAQSPESLNAFSLGNGGLSQFSFLLVMAAVAATTLAALARWFQERRVTRRKWWWLLAILVGAFRVSMNWTTADFAAQALTIQAFSLSASRDGLIGPWILSFSIPAGAIAFLMNSSRRREPPAERQTPPAPPAPLT